MTRVPVRTESEKMLLWLMAVLAVVGIAGIVGMAYMIAVMPTANTAWMGPGMMGGYVWMGGLAAAMMLVPVLVLILLVFVILRMSGTPGNPRN